MGLIRVIPVWAWALVLALGWGAWQRHLAGEAGAALLQEQKQAAEAREAALRATITETERRLKAQEATVHAAEQAAAAARADAASASDALRGLRAQLASIRAGARPGDPAASGAGTAGRLADVLGECAARYSAVAAAADRAVIAGQACERSYQSLKP